MQCDCGHDVAQRVSTRENNNKGREFFCCPIPRIQGGCAFFKWGKRAREQPPNESHVLPVPNFVPQTPPNAPPMSPSLSEHIVDEPIKRKLMRICRRAQELALDCSKLMEELD